MLTMYQPYLHTQLYYITPVKVAQLEECEKRVLRRRMRQRNDQDMGLTKWRCTAHSKVVLGGDRANEYDNNEAGSQDVDNSTMDAICEELEKSEQVEVDDGEMVNSEPENDDIQAKHIDKQVEIGGGEIEDIDE